jgi:glutamate formiminotransferase
MKQLIECVPNFSEGRDTPSPKLQSARISSPKLQITQTASEYCRSI